MKKICFLVIALLAVAVAVPAMAGSSIYTKQIFANQSTSRTSDTYKLGTYTRKTFVFTGMSSVSNVPQDLRGTATVQCGATSTGPYVTAKDINGNAVTTTANASFDINSLCRYARVVWTRTSNKISTWMFYSE